MLTKARSLVRVHIYYQILMQHKFPLVVTCFISHLSPSPSVCLSLQRSVMRVWPPLCPTRISPAHPSFPMVMHPDTPNSTGEEVGLFITGIAANQV